MAATPILGITQVAQNQNQKEVTINDAILALENATQATMAVAFTANSATLSTAQFQDAVCYACGTLYGAGTLVVPLLTRPFLVDNTGNSSYPVTVRGATGAAVFIAAGTAALLYCDGTNVKNVTAAAVSAGVTTFNTRSGPVTLTASDVSTALGFVPISSTETVTEIVAGVGLNGGTIGTSGTISLAPIVPNSIMANTGTGSAVATGLIIGPNFVTTGGTLALAGGAGSGSVTDVTAGGGLDGGSIVNSGTIALHGVGTATVGQQLQSNGTGGVVWTTAIPAASGELLGGSGTVGEAVGVTVGSNLSLSAGTLSLDGTLTGETLASPVLTGTVVNSGTIVGGVITGLSAPVNASDAATKGYVDGAVQGLSVKPAAAVATTSALPTNVYNNGSSGIGATLTASAAGVLVVDGYDPPAGSWVLVKNEATQANNGLYVATQTGSGSTPWVLTRDVTMDQASGFEGAFVAVEQYGSTLANTLWLCSAASPVTVGTSAVTWTQLNSSTGAQPGAGILVSGNTISLAPIAAGDLLGNPGTGTAAPAPISLGSGLVLNPGGTLYSTGIAGLTIENGGITIGTATALNAGAGLTVSISGGVLSIAAPNVGTVAEVVAGAGLSGGTITSNGTIALAAIPGGELIANAGGSSAVPGATSVTALLDSASERVNDFDTAGFGV